MSNSNSKNDAPEPVKRGRRRSPGAVPSGRSSGRSRGTSEAPARSVDAATGAGPVPISGSDLRLIRLVTDTTQSELAAILGVSQRTISCYEDETFKIPQKVVYRLSPLIDKIEEAIKQCQSASAKISRVS